MRDTSRPALSRKTASFRAPSSGTNSSPPPHRIPLGQVAVAQFNEDAGSQGQGSEEGSNITSTHPWGDVKARGGRGDLVKAGLTTSTHREIGLALSLTSISWATGRHGLEWLFWPEEDEYTLGECIIHCWNLVQRQQEIDRFEMNSLDEYVARKVITFPIPYVIESELTSFRYTTIFMTDVQY